MNEVEIIINVVAQEHGLTPETMMARSQRHLIAHPRQMAMLLAREHTRKSLPVLGRHFGYHHTSIMWGMRAAEARREKLGIDAMYRRCNAKCAEALKAHREEMARQFADVGAEQAKRIERVEELIGEGRSDREIAHKVCCSRESVVQIRKQIRNATYFAPPILPDHILREAKAHKGLGL